MRLWHYKLIQYLPNSQLVAQWRELNSIFKNQNKHILINYVYEYTKFDLKFYTNLVLKEMEKRKIKIKSTDNYNEYFKGIVDPSLLDYYPFIYHHTNRYLLQCFYNLQEKYDRGQKDFSDEQYARLVAFMKHEGLLHDPEVKDILKKHLNCSSQNLITMRPIYKRDEPKAFDKVMEFIERRK
ncbi:pyrimidine dimer DNA glycosylase/endonuclease V [Mammaliicoccus vitulinus]|uniref:pyrimidine dimer DNA glycosylase/endonuclease V n=1 Tax=Mammaliicoccus vitulinus TaxID=71237 RepID=UPI00248AA8A5|nr:pyrimidine dimer DNA glycosylase/endonuclease V [Mammaliicoccus vitulinus]